MTEKAVKAEAEPLPDLDDLLQCPVCYEIPTGQIFQCNEGHHVCGRCKLRLDVCPVCRAFFFGTRNYAMEELIANIRKLRAFKLGGKVTTGNTTPEQQIEAKESTSEENESTNNDEEDELSRGSANRTFVEPPRPCSGLFRCLCCKTNPERLPSARLLNHLRYFHSPELIEGRSDESGEYVQAWQFSTEPGRIVTAVRIGDMGLFFLVIEITFDSVFSWLVMAASPRVAEEFSYTYTLSGNDREAIFSDVVWSVRTCEGFLKKRLRCLSVTGMDARALLAPSTMSAKLRVRRTPLDVAPHQTQPRAVLRVANRSAHSDAAALDPAADLSQEFEPFLQDLQNDVRRLSRAFATLGREANALVRSEAEMRARLETNPPEPPAAAAPAPAPAPEAAEDPQPAPEPAAPLSRNARRRMRQRLRQAFRESQTIDDVAPPTPAATIAARQTNGQALISLQNNNSRVQNAQITASSRADNQTGGQNRNTIDTTRVQNNQGDRANNNQHRENTVRGANNRAHSPIHAVFSGFAVVMEPAPVAPSPILPPAAGAGPAFNGTGGRNKKKRRQRR